MEFSRRIAREKGFGSANCGVGKDVSTLIVLPMCYAIDRSSIHRGSRRVCNGERDKNNRHYLFLVISGVW